MKKYALGAGLLLLSCSKPVSTTERPQESAADAEARDVVRVLRALYPFGQEVGRAAWAIATCHDETKGYDALVRCEAVAAARVEQVAAAAPAGPLARSQCGKTVETAHRQYLEGRRRLHAEHLAWLRDAKAKLSRPMAQQTQADACSEKEARCQGEPTDFEPKNAASDYSNISAIECVKPLFDCDPPTGNVCWIGKVADRLGLEESKTRGPLRVRATGTEL